MSETIEEAFKALDEAVHVYGLHMRNDRREVMERARALVLAVLEELRPAITVGYMTCEADSDDQCPYHTFRARIEALDD